MPLTNEDIKALSESVDDLSDIDERQLARIDAGFARAYAIAKGIGDGTLNPLVH